MDKIGWDGVKAELLEAGFPQENVEKYLDLFQKITPDTEGVALAKELLEGTLDPTYADGLIRIMHSVEAVRSADFRIVFDPTLVRGMSYYTGPIFEIAMDEYGGSVGGGGRYDTMVGRFLGAETPAVGFSIGFERISMLLMERGYSLPDAPEKKAFLIDKKCSDEQIREVITKANDLRRSGAIVTVDRMKKNKKFQKEQLTLQGFSAIEEVFAD